MSSTLQLVPPDTMRAIVQTVKRSMHTAAMLSSGQKAVISNPLTVRNQLLEVKVQERRLAWNMAGHEQETRAGQHVNHVELTTGSVQAKSWRANSGVEWHCAFRGATSCLSIPSPAVYPR